MIYEVRIRPEAEKDIDEAATWYESQREGLGELFLDEISNKIKIISEQPLLYPPVYRNTRRALIKKFPFGIFYRFEDGIIVVISIMHGSRDPRRWTERT